MSILNPLNESRGICIDLEWTKEMNKQAASILRRNVRDTEVDARTEAEMDARTEAEAEAETRAALETKNVVEPTTGKPTRPAKRATPPDIDARIAHYRHQLELNAVNEVELKAYVG